MVLVSRTIKIVFLIQSAATIDQIKNYLTNTIYPEWRTRLATAFDGYVSGAPIIDSESSSHVYQIPGFSDRYGVYPKVIMSLEVPTGTGDDARTRWHNFIEDVREWTRQQIATLTNTTVLSIHWHTAAGGSGDVSF